MKHRRFTCILLSAVLVISLAMPVFAAQADVTAGSGISYENAGETGSVEVTGYAGGAQHLEKLDIPSTMQDETGDEPVEVTGIADDAYRDDSALKALTVADGIQKIGASAFAGCSNLESVILPDSVTSIGERAFADCVKLTAIDIPTQLESISNELFQGCDSLSSIVIPNGVKSIGDQAFSGCKSLISVRIPESVESIGSNVFSDTALKSIHYGGTKEQWSTLTENREDVPENVLISCSDGLAGDAEANTFAALIGQSGTDEYWIDSEGRLHGVTISTAKERTTAATIAEKLDAPEDVRIEAVSGDGEPLSADAAIGTGCRLIMSAASDPDIRFDEVLVVTNDDILGSGELSLSQIAEYCAIYRNGSLVEPFKSALEQNELGLSAITRIARRYADEGICPTGAEQRIFALSGPTGPVYPGEVITIRIDALAEGAYADITTEGLENVAYSGGLSSEQHVFLLEDLGGRTASFFYRVTAQAGETVSFGLSAGAGSTDRKDFAAQGTQWSATVKDRALVPDPIDKLKIQAIRSGDTVTLLLHVDDDDNVKGVTGDIDTSGLELISYAGGLSDADDVILIKDIGDLTGAYKYRITGTPGTNVSFRLSNVVYSIDDVDVRGVDVSWEGPAVQQVQPPAVPARLQITAPDNVETDRTVSVTIGYEDGLGIEGCAADISVSGLEFLECTGGLSDKSNLLIADALGGNTVTYTYRVTAKVGETVSLSVSDMIYSDGYKDCRGLNSEWKAAVWPPATSGVRIDAAQQVVSGDSVYITCQSIGPGVLGVVRTEGLQFDYVFSGSQKNTENNCLSSENLCLVFQYEPVIYRYKVTAAPGETASFSLTRCVASDGSTDSSIPDAVWSAPAQGARRDAVSAGSSWDAAGDARWVVPSAYEVESGGTVGIDLQTKDGELRYSIKSTPLLNAEYKPLDVQSDQVLSGAKSASHSGTVSGKPGDGVKLVLEGTWSAPGRVQSIRRDLGNITITGKASDTPTEPGDGSHGSSSGTEETPSAKPSPSPDVTPSDKPQNSASATPSETPSGSPSASATPSPEASPTVRPQPTVASGGTSPTANPIAITSLSKIMRGEYTITDGYLRGQQSQDRFKRTTVNDLTSSMDLPKNFSLLVFDNKGGRRMANDALGTGCQVILSRSEGLRMDSAIAVVRGDVLGTGEIGLSQLVRMAMHLSNKKTLADAYLYAGDWNNDGNVTISDLTREAAELKKARTQ